MHFLALPVVLLLVVVGPPFAAASPLLPRQANNGTTTTGSTTTQLTFTGAGASFTIQAPVDGSKFQLGSDLSVNTIAQTGSASCSFTGVNGAQLTVLGANTGATLAPPQQITAGKCVAI